MHAVFAKFATPVLAGYGEGSGPDGGPIVYAATAFIQDPPSPLRGQSA